MSEGVLPFGMLQTLDPRTSAFRTSGKSFIAPSNSSIVHPGAFFFPLATRFAMPLVDHLERSYEVVRGTDARLELVGELDTGIVEAGPVQEQLCGMLRVLVQAAFGLPASASPGAR